MFYSSSISGDFFFLITFESLFDVPFNCWLMHFFHLVFFLHFLDMVCYEEGTAQCVILNMTPGANTKKIILTVRPSNKVSTLFSDIKNQMSVENFDISLQASAEEDEVSAADLLTSLPD